METQALTIERASAMPAPTWHFLKMNDTQLEIPEGLAISPAVTVEQPSDTCGAVDAFEGALAAAQADWEKLHPEPTPQERAELEAYMKAEADATYGGTAQSAYQIGADAMEEARSLSVAFENGVGDEAAAYMRYAAGERVVIEAAPGKSVEAQVIVSAVPNSLSAAAIDVVAARNSSVNLSIVVDSPDGAAAGASGFAGSTVRVFADADARVSIVRTQTLDLGYTDIDDMGLFAHDRARIEVRQTVLGAGSTFTGLAGDLRGDSANITVDTRYLGHADQEHDFNYILRHHGTRTECDLNANGVLAGKSSKTLRGTIDLIRGAKGAQGSENETVLLVDEGVKNKTVPVILCNEDDVAGNHGATIGHIRDEQMLYLSCRGLSREEAERMFVGAIMEQAAIDAPDDASRAGVLRLGDSVVPGFSDLFDEEA
jgi:Fe-S cluster assembly scaffold protein SufB